ncbi:TetR/AcrR family transcriptional regulator [Rhodococcus spelaei]|uniref:TetR/AcrR family transcriptional regulator n=1 Tax=Rhodococcus spelaei TaxID=2546320 RepID=A0A541BR72_9NOCA|nr:TetR/AcrR family transcriptional regulator [Rhodococcus spelaei]TQF74824.1 TetR/AcrR family transcriptional regulator [Rhodococcus spelaei]
MARPPDHAKRAEILAQVIDYIGERGLADLSLRPLAAALGTSSRMLIHYFGSKEELLAQALATQRPDIEERFADVSSRAMLPARMRELWAALTSGEHSTHTRVLLQVMGTACVQQGPFVEYSTAAIETLVASLTGVLVRLGSEVGEATVVSTLLVSGLRGILLDRLITGDIERTDLAAQRLIDLSLG